MSASFNKCIFIGNLTRDPEIRYVQSGSAVAKFTIAINRKHNGQVTATFVDIVVWDKLAEFANEYLKKGMSTLVEGRLSIRGYETKEGDKRKATEIVAGTIQMLDRPARSGTPANAPAGEARSVADDDEIDADLDADEYRDNEIPF